MFLTFIVITRCTVLWRVRARVILGQTKNIQDNLWFNELGQVL